MIDRVISKFIRKGYITEDKKNIYKYGLYVLYLNLIGNGSVLILSILFNQIEFGTLFLALFSFLRITLGGYHAKTPFRCFLSSNLLFLVNLWLYLNINIPFCSSLNLLLNFIVWHIPVLMTRTETVRLLNEKKKKWVCIIYLVLSFFPITIKIIFLSLITNITLYLVEVIKRKKNSIIKNDF